MPGRSRTDIGSRHYGGTTAASDLRWPGTFDRITAGEPNFAMSETPAYIGRAVVALAADPQVARWSGQSLSNGQLARIYGFTDLDEASPTGRATTMRSWRPAGPRRQPDIGEGTKN